jgi:hypothetical protein
MLPEDLDRLGLSLQAAADGHFRRRARRQAFLNGVGAVLLAVPLAIAIMAAPLAPSEGLPIGPSTSASTAKMSFLVVQPIERTIDFRHIPDKPVQPPDIVCLDAKDCRMPHVPSLFPAPAGRV